MMEAVKVYRGKKGIRDFSSARPEDLFGPLPGCRQGNVVAYEFQLAEAFEPWPGRTRLERTFVLLDLGVSFSNPPWRCWRKADGSVGIRDEGPNTWYVDLISVHVERDTLTFLDLYIDAMVATDERHYRVLDLDEYAEAIETGDISLAAGLDGLKRWQRFLDRHLHDPSWTSATWRDFPPADIRELQQVEAPLGAIVTVQ